MFFTQEQVKRFKIKMKGKLKGLTMTKKQKKLARKMRKEQRRMAKKGNFIEQSKQIYSSAYQGNKTPELNANMPYQGNKSYTITKGTANTGNYNYSWFKTCKHDPSFVARLGNQSLWAGTRDNFDRDDLEFFDVVINASQNSVLGSGSKLVKGSRVFSELNADLNFAHEAWLEWEDGGAWLGNLDFWQHMFAINQKEDFNVIGFCCFGGHGRTGTALAAYLIANANLDSLTCFLEPEQKSDPDFIARVLVVLIRKIYCDNAIETKAQLEYLKKLAKERLEQKDTTPTLPIEWAKYRVEPSEEKGQQVLTPLSSVSENEPIFKDSNMSPFDGYDYQQDKHITTDGLDLCPKCNDLIIDCKCNPEAKANEAIVKELEKDWSDLTKGE